MSGDDITYAKPALHDAGLVPRAQHLATVLRLTVRCALRGHEWRSERPTRCVRLSVCRICGNYIGANVADDNPESPCRWFRPSMIKRLPDISPERARQIASEPKPAPLKIDPNERSIW